MKTMLKEMMLEGVIEGMNPRMMETKLRTFLFDAKASASEGRRGDAVAAGATA